MVKMPNNRDDSVDIVNWTPHAKATFMGLLHEQVKKKGYMQTSTFQEKTIGFETKLFSLLGIRFTVKQLKCKFNQLLEQHQLFSWMFKQTEVGWDSSTNNIDVPDDKWEQFIKRSPKIKHFVERVANTMRCLLRFSTPQPSQVNCTMPQPRSLQSLEEESELEEDFLSDGVLVDPNPEIETNENVSSPNPTHGQTPQVSLSENDVHARSSRSKMLSVLQVWTKALAAKIEVSLASADRYTRHTKRLAHSVTHTR